MAVRRNMRRLLAARPPDDRRQRDERYQCLDDREATVHGERSGAADRSSCLYPRTGVLMRRYSPTLQTRLLDLRPLNPTIIACLAVAAAWPLPAQAQGGGEAPPGGTQTPPPIAPELRVERPGGKPLVREGQVNRELLGGTWYFRQDDTFIGEQEHWFDPDDMAGWT